MTIARAITIDLTKSQVADMVPIVDQARASSLEGCPGMILAQVFGNYMKVFFLDHERGIKFQELMGQTSGKTTADLAAEQSASAH